MIYLFTAIKLPPGGSGQYTCTKIGRRQHKWRNNTQNNKKQYKNTEVTQNRTQKYKTKNKHK
jgi:hypothetical protein